MWVKFNVEFLCCIFILSKLKCYPRIEDVLLKFLLISKVNIINNTIKIFSDEKKKTLKQKILTTFRQITFSATLLLNILLDRVSVLLDRQTVESKWVDTLCSERSRWFGTTLIDKGRHRYTESHVATIRYESINTEVLAAKHQLNSFCCKSVEVFSVVNWHACDLLKLSHDIKLYKRFLKRLDVYKLKRSVWIRYFKHK